jgi:hypothetical protein
LSIYGLGARFSQALFTSYHRLTMSSTLTVITPGLFSVANLLVSIQQNSSIARASTSLEGLQATQPLFEDDMHMAPTPLKVEKEGDTGMLGLPGGG